MILNYEFEFNHKTRILFASGSVLEVGNETIKYGKKAIIVCDKGVLDAGIVDKVRNNLTSSGIEYKVYSDVMPNPRDTGCDRVAKMGKEYGADVIIGVGGGSAMDTAKAASVLITNGKTCEYWAEVRKIPNLPLPVICVPTTSGTGSEVTYESVITVEDKETKISISDGSIMAPKVAIMDPELTLTVPPLVTASTGMDALTHAIEAFTCTYAQPVSDSLAVDAIKYIEKSIYIATEQGSNLEARTHMLLGSMMAGMAFTNSYLGAVHSLSEIIGGYYDTPHGIANAIFLPYVTKFNVAADPEKHKLVADYLGIDTRGKSDEEGAYLGVDKLFEMNDRLGIPKFKEVKNVNEKDFEKIAESCTTHGCAAANPRPITKNDFLNILNEAYNA